MRLNLAFIFLSLIATGIAFAAHHISEENLPPADGKAVSTYLSQQEIRIIPRYCIRRHLSGMSPFL